MANPQVFAKEAFENNVLLIKALTLLKPPKERKRVTEWVETLTSFTSSYEDYGTRNEYLWYLLMILQHGSLDSPPFNRAPGAGLLTPLSSILSKEAYQEVMKGTKNEIFFHDTMNQLYKDRLARSGKSPSKQKPQGRETQGRGSQRDKEEQSYLDEITVDKKALAAEDDDDFTHPAEFFRSQPKPDQGAYCYAAVFSDNSNQFR